MVFPTDSPPRSGVLGAFGDRGVRICSDEHNQASIVDGQRLSQAEVAVYRHRDVDTSSTARRGHGPGARASPTSCSPWTATSPRCETSPRRAGATVRCSCSTRRTSSCGPDLGAELYAVEPASTSCAWARCRTPSDRWADSWPVPRPFIDLLVNRARSYSSPPRPPRPTAPPRSPPCASCRRPKAIACGTRLATHIEQVAPGHPSQIIPIVLGTDERARAASAALREHGVWVPAIVPPVVAPGHGPAARHALRRAQLRAHHTAPRRAGIGAVVGPSTAPRPGRVATGPRLRPGSATRTILPSLPPWAKRS